MQPNDLLFSHYMLAQRCDELMREVAADRLATRARRSAGRPARRPLDAVLAAGAGLLVLVAVRGILGL